MFDELLKTHHITTIKQLDQVSPSVLRQTLQTQHIPSWGLRHNSHTDFDAYLEQGSLITDISYHWPSAGLACLMHKHIVLALKRYESAVSVFPEVLNAVSENDALIASLSAEGLKTNNEQYSPLTHSQTSDGDWQLTGTKTPATLCNIADYYLCVSVDASSVTDDSTAAIKQGMAVIPDGPTLSRNNDIWQLEVFNASDTQAICFDNTIIPFDHIVTDEILLDMLLHLALGSFEYMTMCAYLGIASRLADNITHTYKPWSDLQFAIARITMFRQAQLPVIAEQSFQADTNKLARDFVQSSRYFLERLIDELVLATQKHMSANLLVSNPDYQHLINTVNMLRYHPRSEKKYTRRFLPKFDH